MLSSYLLVLA
jgi:hypothetical protein